MSRDSKRARWFRGSEAREAMGESAAAHPASGAGEGWGRLSVRHSGFLHAEQPESVDGMLLTRGVPARDRVDGGTE